MELFITKLFEQPAYYISGVATFAGSICVHEYCHAFVAHHLGDDTAKEGGFMTLISNSTVSPGMKHLPFFGVLMQVL